MGCGCGGSQTMVYVFTAPNGVSKTYTKEIQAQVAQIKAGGGTITPTPK